MAWIIPSILLFLNPALQNPDSLFLQESKQQIDHYISNIQNNKDVAINLWALAEISRDKSNLLSYINSHIQKRGYSRPILKTFQDTSLSHTTRLRKLAFFTESPTLLVAYILTEGDPKAQKKAFKQFRSSISYPSTGEVNYFKIVQAILEKRKIEKSILPAKKFHPVHFFLFYNNDIIRGETFSKEYLATVGSTWKFSSEFSLKNVLGIASLYRAFYEQYEYSETDRLYHPIINDELFPNSALKLTLFRSLDYSMYRLGYYNRSLEIIRDFSLPLAKFLDHEEIALKIRIAQGAYLYRIGKIEKSRKIYTDILNESTLESFEVSKARVFNNLAINYWKSGEFDHYLDLQFQALKEAKIENSYKLQFDVLKNLYTHYRVNKNFSSAEQYLDNAQELAQKQQDSLNLAQVSYFRGQLYRDSESEIDRAIISFNEALNFISQKNNYSSYQNILSEKAALFEKKSENIQARNIYNQVINTAQNRNDRRNTLYASFNKANSYLNTSQIDSAEAILDTLNTETLDALDFYQLVKAKTVQARYQQEVGYSKKGAQLLQPAIQQIVSRSRGSGDLETGFWQVEPEYLDAFELYANLLISTNKTEQAVEVLDRLKTINDAALYQNPLVRSKVLNEKELSEYKRLTDELDVLRKNLLAASEDQKDEIQQKIDEKSARKSMYDRRISSMADNDPVSINEVQRRMDAHHRVFHITALNDVYYLAIISRTDVEFKKIPITTKLKATFEKSIQEIANGNTNLKQLYSFNQLLGISNLPSHVDKLTIIPDSYLYQIPVDILPLQKPANDYSYGETTYLVERYETNYMTSLNDFSTKSQQQTNYTYDYAGYGVSRFNEDRAALVPLPEAAEEIQLISNQLTKLPNKRLFLNENATEQAFRDNASKARILHLATHSEVASQDPMFSSFYLSRSETDDQNRFPGRIFAYELFELNLSNELIMLNSCESGSGSYLQGTGVVGISRALRFAGAQSLVLNIWSVNDMMASEFAVKFYEGINKGQSKSEALRNAKLYFLQTKNANPHYWGSYMLLGNQQPILHPNRMTNNIVAASFILFFFSIAMASSIVEIKRRKKKG